MIDYRPQNNNESLLDKGIALYNQKAFDQALAAFQKVVAIKPDFAVAHYNIGNVYSDLGKPDEAIASYRKAIKAGGLDEDAALAWYNLGNIYYRQNDIAKAINAYRTAISINRGLAMAYNNLGFILSAQPDKANQREAITILEDALKLKSDDIDILNNLGIAYATQGKTGKAGDFFNKALELNPQDTKAYINSARVLAEKGDINKAIARLKKAIKIAPDDAIAYYNIGCYLSKKKRYGQAITAYLKTLQLRPDDFNCLYNLGGDYLKTKNYVQAVEIYQKAVKANPTHPSGYFNLAHAFEESGDITNAIATYKKAIEIKPDHADAYYNISNTYRKQGQLNEALKPMETSLMIYQKQKNHLKAAHCCFHLGSIYAGMSEHKKALQMHLKSLGIARKLKEKGLTAANYSMLIGLYGQLNDTKKSRQAAKEFLKIVK